MYLEVLWNLGEQQLTNVHPSRTEVSLKDYITFGLISCYGLFLLSFNIVVIFPTTVMLHIYSHQRFLFSGKQFQKVKCVYKTKKMKKSYLIEIIIAKMRDYEGINMTVQFPGLQCLL